MAGTSASWRNWAGTAAAEPREVITPRSADEVAAAVRRAGELGTTVRMTGAGHSFTPAAITDGIMLLPGGMTGIRSVDAAAGLVTAAAGCPLRTLNEELLRHGLALANLGDIQVQTVAGAIQTGTHGTGRDAGGMAAQVAGLELVLADGTITSCSASANPDLFNAARVGLGALGVLTAVTFRVVPAFLLEAREEPMRWGDVIGRLDDLTRDNEHFEFFWFPHTDGCLTKRNNHTAGPARPRCARCAACWSGEPGGSASRSRSGSPPATIRGCPPGRAGTAPTSPSTSSMPRRMRTTSARRRRCSPRPADGRTGARCTPGMLRTCAASIRGSATSPRSATSWTRSGGSPTPT